MSYSKLLLARERHGYIAWHRAAAKGNLQALETLRSWNKEAELNPDNLLLAINEEGHAVARLVEALRYKPKVMSSIPDGVIGFFH